MAAKPVGHYQSLVMPFIAENGGDEVIVLRRIRAVEPVVAAHDGPWLAVLHRDLEGAEVYLAEGAFASDGIYRVGVCFLVFGGKVFDGAAPAIGLDAFDCRRGYPARDERVFRIIFKVAAAQ